jgi:VWFA-related protein
VASDADAPPITFRSSTHIVVEDVVITDSKGHSVKDLSQQDFHVTEDGKSQTVRSFEEFPHAGATPATSAIALAASSQPFQPAPKLPPNIYTNNRPAGPETGSATMVVLDLLNTPIPDQQRAREQLIGFIRKNPGASEMALCTLASNLRLIQGFTHDENALIAAVHGKKGGVKAPPWQSDSGMERAGQLARDAVAVGAGTVEQLQRAQLMLDSQNAADLDVRMRFTLDAFTQLARYLSGIPGRKNLVWLSGSFPLNIFPNPDVTDFQPVTRNYEFQVKKATNLLADAHVAVYPVGLSGVQTQSMFDVGNTGPYNQRLLPGSEGPAANAPGASAANLANTSANLPISSQMDRDTRTFRETVSGQQATMEQVAADTGGKAFLNTNGIEDAIKTAVDEGSHYYTFSYSPTNKSYDGKFRKIKVNLEGKGYHLAYRRGYYAVDPDAGAKDTRAPAQRIGVAAMQQGSPESRQIVFSIRVVPLGKPHKVDTATSGMATTKKKGAPAGPVEMQHYGIDYAVDPSDLRFGITSSNTYHSVLSFMVTGFNDDGRLVASLVNTATSDLKPANYKDVLSGGFRLHQELDVPTEAVTLRLGVEDATSSHVGTMEIPLPVPVPPDAPQIAAHTLPPIEPD